MAAIRLSGDLCGDAWLREWLTDEREIPAGTTILLPSTRPPSGAAPRGRIVCNCFNVSESEIGNRLAACAGPSGRALALLQTELKCGTNCGSCLPELRRLASARREPMDAVAP